MLVVFLVACNHGHDKHDRGTPAVLISSLTPSAASGGIFAASPVDVNLPLTVTVDGVVADASWKPVVNAKELVWSVPELPPGPVEVEFRSEDGRFDRRDFTISAPWFEDVSAAVGLDGYQDVEGWPSECAQSLMGFGFADIDLDGDLDVVRGHLGAPAQLFVNQGDTDGDGLPNFVDQSAATGFQWTATGADVGGYDSVVSVSFADLDNDGDPDLFLGRAGNNTMLENRFVPTGTPLFVDITSTSGLARADQRTTDGGWGDYDGDGLLDLMEVNHSHCYPTIDVDPRNEDHLYHNQGNGHFVEVSGMLPDTMGEVSARFGFAAVWVDYDRDGDQDLWVVNDVVADGRGSVMYANDGPGVGDAWKFHDATAETGISILRDSIGKGVNAMGAAVGDLNRDGFPDFATSNIGPNILLVSDGLVDGGPHWTNVAPDYGTERTVLPWGDNSTTWGTHLLDLDLDGDLDLLYVGGPLKGKKVEPDALFENQGDGTMIERTWDAGIATTRHAGASAQVDLDGDGYLDVVEATWAGPLLVWHNLRGRDGEERHWLTVDAWGDGVNVNRDGFGAIVELTRVDGAVDTCFRNPMPSMSSTGDWGCHFGLADATAVQRVHVIWPDGTAQDAAVDGVDRRIEVVR